jgi:inosine-uridine nucleoside N-ribohydrolase
MVPARVLFLLIAFIAPLTHSLHADESESNQQRTIPRKILFDTDPGGDDIFALMWLQSLARQGHAEMVAVTTVGGNVGARQTFENASRILALGGTSRVEVGRCVTVDKDKVDAAHIHGTDGMGNLSRTLPKTEHHFDTARSASEIIIEKLRQQPHEIIVVAVGPLTNLAAAERQSPGILAKAKEVVVMGGAFRRRGNITSQAEFNIYRDPAAAETVFRSRDDIVVLPLDVTTRVTFTVRHAEAIRRAVPNSVSEFLTNLARFLAKTTAGFRESEGTAGFLVHDATTLAYLFYPETLLLRRAHVHVETEGKWTRGKTVFDERHGAKRAANAWVALQVDATNLIAIMSEDLKLFCGMK